MAAGVKEQLCYLLPTSLRVRRKRGSVTCVTTKPQGSLQLMIGNS